MHIKLIYRDVEAGRYLLEIDNEIERLTWTDYLPEAKDMGGLYDTLPGWAVHTLEGLQVEIHAMLG